MALQVLLDLGPFSMSESEAPPPAYNAASADRTVPPGSEPDAILPTYTPPTQFNIGPALTREPLVKIVEIKGHLALLHAFAELKKRVQSLEEVAQNGPLDDERRWAWFVGLAVERFDTWCRSLKPNDSHPMDMNLVLPPIDVLMVWHSYMLNPRWYAEDCMRIEQCKVLKRYEGRFGRLLEHPTSPIFTASPSKARVEFWHSRTSLSFDPFEDMHTTTTKVIFCPKCKGSIRVPFLNSMGTGYLQQKFSTTCVKPSCGFGEITKAKLALRKLAKDLAARTNSDASSHLAGTYFTESPLDANRGNTTKKNICDKGLAACPAQPLQYKQDCALSNSKHRSTAQRRMPKPSEISSNRSGSASKNLKSSSKEGTKSDNSL